MSAPITNLQAAQRDAIMNRPAVNGFPHLAETLRRAGVRTNTWWLPAMQSLYETDYGPVLDQGVPLIDGVAEVPAFDRTALVTALRADQAGQEYVDIYAASVKDGRNAGGAGANPNSTDAARIPETAAG